MYACASRDHNGIMRVLMKDYTGFVFEKLMSLLSWPSGAVPRRIQTG